MSLNVLALAALADRIASYFSVDASHWPVPAGERRAIPVQWLAGEAGAELRQVVDALRARTVAPYHATGDASAVPIVTEGEHEPALAVITFWRDDRADDAGVRYELAFPDREDRWPGRFSLRAG